MGKNSKRVNGIRVASAVMALSLFGGIATSIPAFSTQAETSSYVELYSPLNQIQISMDRPEYLSASVKNNAKTESGKGLALDYTAGHTGSVNVTLPLTITETAQDFKGLAMWVDVPETADTYSFTMYIVKNQAVWQGLAIFCEMPIFLRFRPRFYEDFSIAHGVFAERAREYFTGRQEFGIIIYK